MYTEAKNKIGKLLNIKGARQRDLVEYLKNRNIPGAQRQHISIYARGEHNPRRGTEVRSAICDYFGLTDKEIFD